MERMWRLRSKDWKKKSWVRKENKARHGKPNSSLSQ